MDDMTLGARIAALRGENKLSQGDLAERLDVSRQAVSKWETDGSVPEVDKLIKMSEMFGVSLDTLIKGTEPVQSEPVVQSAPPVSSAPAAPAVRSGQETVGYILFGVGLFTCVLGLVLGLLLLFIGVPLMIMGGVMAKGTRKAVLITLWVMMALALLFLNSVTGIQITAVFSPIYYQHTSPLAIILAWAIWGMIALLAYFTTRQSGLKGSGWMALVWTFGFVTAIQMLQNVWFFISVLLGIDGLHTANREQFIMVMARGIVERAVILAMIVGITLWWRRKMTRKTCDE